MQYVDLDLVNQNRKAQCPLTTDSTLDRIAHNSFKAEYDEHLGTSIAAHLAIATTSIFILSWLARRFEHALTGGHLFASHHLSCADPFRIQNCV